ncbi:MAG: hypothetical protein AB8H03_28315 [Saprospiraceae bacterium]
MKNNKLQTSLFSLVILLSIFSYAFLHTIETPSSSIDPSLDIEQIEIEKLSTQETLMPDVKIVKTAVELLKNMVPVSQ